MQQRIDQETMTGTIYQQSWESKKVERLKARVDQQDKQIVRLQLELAATRRALVDCERERLVLEMQMRAGEEHPKP